MSIQPSRILPMPLLAAFVLMLFALRSTPATAGLIGHWSFDGCSATDASGNGANLTVQNSPTCVAGRFGAAWNLDGTTQYLDRPSDVAFKPGTRAWTVAAWEKATSATPGAFIVSWYQCGADPSCGTGDAAFYGLGLLNGNPYWDVRDDAGSDLSITEQRLNVADNQWHFLVGTMNPATDSLKLYVDGALDSTLHGPMGGISRGTVGIPLEVGRLFRTGWAQPAYYFPGALMRYGSSTKS